MALVPGEFRVPLVEAVEEGAALAELRDDARRVRPRRSHEENLPEAFNSRARASRRLEVI